jgi:flagellar biosynthesis component FlhA
MSRNHAPPERTHKARSLAGALFREPKHKRSQIVRISLIVGGTLCLAAGLLLAVLPVVPGFPLLILGVLLLAAGSAFARRTLNSLEQRLPTGWRRTIRRVARKQENHLEPTAHADGEVPAHEGRDIASADQRLRE